MMAQSVLRLVGHMSPRAVLRAEQSVIAVVVGAHVRRRSSHGTRFYRAPHTRLAHEARDDQRRDPALSGPDFAGLGIGGSGSGPAACRVEARNLGRRHAGGVLVLHCFAIRGVFVGVAIASSPRLWRASEEVSGARATVALLVSTSRLPQEELQLALDRLHIVFACGLGAMIDAWPTARRFGEGPRGGPWGCFVVGCDALRHYLSCPVMSAAIVASRHLCPPVWGATGDRLDLTSRVAGLLGRGRPARRHPKSGLAAGEPNMVQVLAMITRFRLGFSHRAHPKHLGASRPT